MENYKDLVEKIEQLKKEKGADLSMDEDLSLAVMNLISLEEHFFFTGARTEKTDYFNLLEETREMRKSLMAKLMDKNEGETWCAGKHLLAASMRLMEVGTKLQSDGKKPKAEEFFAGAYKLYSMFWALKLKLIDLKDFKEAAASEKPWTMQDIVNKLVNCCDE